jgi:hypothetical protein
MGPEYRVLPEQTVGGHVVSGFASQTGDAVRVLVYSHHMLDTESRSEAEFEVTLELAGVKPGPVCIRQYHFDKDHNSYFRLARRLRDEADPKRPPDAAQARRLQEALGELESKERETQLAGLEKLGDLGPAAASAAGTLFQFLQRVDDAAVRGRAVAVLKRVTAPRAYPAAVVRQVEELAALRPTGLAWPRVGRDGRLSVTVRVGGNGANCLVIDPAGPFPPVLFWQG